MKKIKGERKMYLFGLIKLKRKKFKYFLFCLFG